MVTAQSKIKMHVNYSDGIVCVVTQQYKPKMPDTLYIYYEMVLSDIRKHKEVIHGNHRLLLLLR